MISPRSHTKWQVQAVNPRTRTQGLSPSRPQLSPRPYSLALSWSGPASPLAGSWTGATGGRGQVAAAQPGGPREPLAQVSPPVPVRWPQENRRDERFFRGDLGADQEGREGMWLAQDLSQVPRANPVTHLEFLPQFPLQGTATELTGNPGSTRNLAKAWIWLQAQGKARSG